MTAVAPPDVRRKPSPIRVPAKLKLREAAFADYPQISEVTARCGLRMRDYEEWRHVWCNQPEFPAGWPIGWVLENGAGRVVGSVGNIPLAYELGGRKLRAAASHNWVVDEEYRGYALLLIDEFFNQANVDLFFSTTVNREAVEAYRMFDSPEVPRGNWDRAAFWITNYRGFAESALREKGWKFAAALSFPVGAALRIRDGFSGTRLNATGIEVREETGFDQRFDVFWERLRAKNREILLGTRTREALQWHFENSLRRNETYILTVSEGSRPESSRIVAYSIFYRKDAPEVDLKRVRLVDYQCLNGDRRHLEAMLAKMLTICRRDRVHMLEDVGCTIDAVRAPHVRTLPSWLFYYKANGPLVETLRDPAMWRPSLFDGDSTL